MNKKLLSLFSAVLLVTVVGCTTVPKPKPSGFLGSYANIVESEEYEGWHVNTHSSKNLGHYSKFLVEPVKIYFHPDAVGTETDTEKLKELTDYFNQEIVDALSENYTVVDEPGEGVLRIRTALTDVIPNKIYLNLHWSTTASGAGVGGAAVEAEFIDSLTGEQVLAAMDARKGNRLKYVKGLKKLGHAESMVKGWTKTLIQKIEDLKEENMGE